LVLLILPPCCSAQICKAVVISPSIYMIDKFWPKASRYSKGNAMRQNRLAANFP